MRIYNPFKKEFRTVEFKDDIDMDCMKYEPRLYKGRQEVMRVWYNGWFPLNPVKGLDIKCKDWGKEYKPQYTKEEKRKFRQIYQRSKK